MMYLHHSKECLLEHVKPCIFKSKEVTVEMLDFYQKQALVNLLPLIENDLMTSGSAILFHGQKYSLGDVIITGFSNDDYTFGLVDAVTMVTMGDYGTQQGAINQIKKYHCLTSFASLPFYLFCPFLEKLPLSL